MTTLRRSGARSSVVITTPDGTLLRLMRLANKRRHSRALECPHSYERNAAGRRQLACEGSEDSYPSLTREPLSRVKH